MNKKDLIIMALLVEIAIEGAICARTIRKIAREGFSMELTVEQADSLAQSITRAKEQAAKDIKNE